MKLKDVKLAPKIIVLLIIVVFGLMGIFGFFQIKKIEQGLNSDAEKNHVLLLSNSVGVFAKAVWEFDKDIAVKGMEPLFESGTVKSIRIFDARGNVFEGRQYSKGIDGKNLLNEISEENKKYGELKIGDPSIPVKQYNESAALVVSNMINFPGQNHRLIASLWWKENPTSDANFLGNVVMDFSTEYIGARIKDQKIGFTIMAISLGLAILVLTILFLQFQVIAPIRRLMRASLDVADGKYTKVKQPKNRDEIGRLSENFNFMVNKIEHNLTLIRGLSEASQEIVKCKTPQEVALVYGNYAQKLVQAEKVEIWINTLSESSSDAKDLIRLSDNKEMNSSNPILSRISTARDIINQDGQEEHDADFLHALVVPLINANGVLLGMVEIFYNKYKVKYAEEEVRIIKGLAVSLTTAIENYWHVLKEKNRANVERDLELAGAVQDSIISRSFPKSDLYDISTYYKTASQCGGDWFGVYKYAEDKVLILFGDVTGHGTPAALMTAVTRGAGDMFKQLTLAGDYPIDETLPAKALEYISECIYQTGKQSYFMTMVAAFFDFTAQKMFAASAGHTPPAFMIKGAAKTDVKYIYPKTGSRLGFEAGVKYEIQMFDFKPGQQIVFYTDGIVEGENKVAKEYGFKKFKSSMEIHGSKDPESFLKGITDDAFKFFDGTPPKDDIAILLLRFHEK
jgi:sigma-B regulation protein RsbU (phosphoserine phosphatase)